MTFRAILTVASILASLWFGYSQGSNNVQSKFDQYKASAAQQNAEAQIKVSSSHSKILEEKARELQTVSNQRDALLVRLRERPTREQSAVASSSPVEGSSNTEAASVTACGPDQLYREDAEFLANLASDAETVRQELISTRNAYESIRTALEN